MPSAEKPKRINVRRPDIMEKVKAEVVTHYRSELVEHLRANGCTFAYGNTGIHLAKEFGFCYGVERAIDLAYACLLYTSPSPRDATLSRMPSSA